MATERTELEHYFSFERNNSLLTQIRLMTTAQSMGRYRFAVRTISGQGGITIDAACGSGWGTNYLSVHTDSKQVIGIDYNSRVIKQAGDAFQRANLHFQQADLREPCTFDGIGKALNITSFETIEHVSKEDAVVVLGNLHSAHSGEGKLIISTPNRPLFSPYHDNEGGPWNPYHIFEYDAAEFTNLLQSSGWSVDKLYGQFFLQSERYFAITRAVYPFRRLFLKLGSPRDSLLSKMMVILPSLLLAADAKDCDVQPLNSKQDPLFLVAVCSKK